MDVVEDLHVGPNHLVDARMLDLDHDPAAVGQRRRVHLGDRCRRQRLLVEAGSRTISASDLQSIPGVAAVATRPSPHPRLDEQPAVVEIGGTRIGSAGGSPVIMAGPCSVESREQIRTIAGRLSRLGVRFLRGGVDKIRTSPYAFRGHGAQALGWLREGAAR